MTTRLVPVLNRPMASAMTPDIAEKAHNMRTARFSEKPIATILWEEWSLPPCEIGRRNNFRMTLTKPVSRIGMKTMRTGIAITERICTELLPRICDGLPTTVRQASMNPI